MKHLSYFPEPTLKWFLGFFLCVSGGLIGLVVGIFQTLIDDWLKLGQTKYVLLVVGLVAVVLMIMSNWISIMFTKEIIQRKRDRRYQ